MATATEETLLVVSTNVLNNSTTLSTRASATSLTAVSTGLAATMDDVLDAVESISGSVVNTPPAALTIPSNWRVENSNP